MLVCLLSCPPASSVVLCAFLLPTENTCRCLCCSWLQCAGPWAVFIQPYPACISPWDTPAGLEKKVLRSGCHGGLISNRCLPCKKKFPCKCMHVYMSMYVCVLIKYINSCQEKYWTLGKFVWWANRGCCREEIPIPSISHLQGRSYLPGKLWGTAEKQPIKQVCLSFNMRIKVILQ